MSSTDAPSAAPTSTRQWRDQTRVAFLGPRAWLDGCMPAQSPHLRPERFELSGDAGTMVDALKRFRPEAIVVLDPRSATTEALSALRDVPALKLGMLVAETPADDVAWASAFDRIACFDPSLTASPLGERHIWRAVPPPVSDVFFVDRPRPLHRVPRALSIGRSTPHREWMLTPSKHDHDLLQVIHGIGGGDLAELLSESDVGVYVAPERGGRFGHQAAVHLAAGQLLLAEELSPAHGLECGIDYVRIDSPARLAWVLHRLGRFPEMHFRPRIRGRMKAEQFRASRLFSRVVHDLRADVAAFGRSDA
jgi:hypothetical protein